MIRSTWISRVSIWIIAMAACFGTLHCNLEFNTPDSTSSDPTFNPTCSSNTSTICLADLTDSEFNGDFEEDHFTQNLNTDDDELTITNEFSFSNNCRLEGDTGATTPSLDCEGVADDDLENFDYMLVFQCISDGTTVRERIICRDDNTENNLADIGITKTCTGTIDFDGPDGTVGTTDDFTFSADLSFTSMDSNDVCSAAWVEVSTTDEALLLIDQVNFTSTDDGNLDSN